MSDPPEIDPTALALVEPSANPLEPRPEDLRFGRDLDLGRLTPEERTELYFLLERLVGGESLAAFIDRIVPREPLPDHCRVIADVLSAARLRPVRVCIAMPPGSAKTTTLMRGIAWWLSHTPADTCAYVTYSDAQARSKSRIARELSITAGVPVNPEFAGLSEWRTKYGGGLLAAGARGKLMGQRIPGLVIYDDPYKNREQVESEAVRERIWENFREGPITRLEGGSCIVVHTPWSEDDLIARCVRDLGWDLILMPAIAEDDNDRLGRTVGEALWPERYPVKRCDGPCGHSGHLEQIRDEIGEWSFSALYQCRPRPRSGGMFKRKDWQIVDASDVPKTGRIVRGWDLAASTSSDAAYTCGVRMRMAGRRIYIEDVRRIRGTPHQVERLITECAETDGHGCEQSLPQDPGQAGKAQRAHLAKLLHGHRFHFSPETGSKEGRAEPLAAQTEAGNVALVQASWNDPFMSEAASFPIGRYKDQVDGATRAYARLISAAQEPAAISGPEIISILGA